MGSKYENKLFCSLEYVPKIKTKRDMRCYEIYCERRDALLRSASLTVININIRACNVDTKDRSKFCEIISFDIMSVDLLFLK